MTVKQTAEGDILALIKSECVKQHKHHSLTHLLLGFLGLGLFRGLRGSFLALLGALASGLVEIKKKENHNDRKTSVTLQKRLPSCRWPCGQHA